MKSLKRKLQGRALLSVSLTAVVLLVSLPGKAKAAMFGGTPVAPTTTVPVFDGNLNGWTHTGYYGTAGYPWPVDNTNPGVLGGFGDLTGDATDGYWHHKAVAENVTPPAGLDFNYFELSYNGPGINGQLVSDWAGFEYRNLQFAGSSNHAGVIFEIDTDGDLGTTEAFARFQPLFAAQEESGSPPAGEWNHYVVDDKDDAFLDAINAGTVNQESFQSINDLFLAIGLKSNAGGGGTPIVLPSDAELISVAITGGLQGFPVIEEYVDFIQFTFGSETTRFDFGQVVPPLLVIPEPSTFLLAVLGTLGLAMRRRLRAYPKRGTGT